MEHPAREYLYFHGPHNNMSWLQNAAGVDVDTAGVCGTIANAGKGSM